MNNKTEAMQAFISIYDKSRKPPKEQETVKSKMLEFEQEYEFIRDGTSWIKVKKQNI